MFDLSLCSLSNSRGKEASTLPSPPLLSPAWQVPLLSVPSSPAPSRLGSPGFRVPFVGGIRSPLK